MLQQKRRKLRKDDLCPVDLRMTSRTECDHQMQQRLARFPMMDSGIGITAHPTGVSVALQDLLSQVVEYSASCRFSVCYNVQRPAASILSFPQGHQIEV